MPNFFPWVRHACDAAAAGIAVATVLKWLPPLAALASFVWTCIQIYDWYKKRKGKK